MERNGANRSQLCSSGDEPLSLVEFLDLHQADEDLKAEVGADDVRDVCRHLMTRK